MSDLENTNTEKNRIGFVQALQILHDFRNNNVITVFNPDLAYALDVIFEWIDNMVLLLHKFGGGKDELK